MGKKKKPPPGKPEGRTVGAKTLLVEQTAFLAILEIVNTPGCARGCFIRKGLVERIIKLCHSRFNQHSHFRCIKINILLFQECRCSLMGL